VFVRANRVELKVNRYCLSADPRAVLVFVHGLGVVDHSGLSFTVGMPLADEHDVVLYALRGHGRSQRASTGYRLDDHVADLFGMVDGLGVAGPVHLVGCSYGGAITLAAAVAEPDRVASLFLVDPVVPVVGWTRPLLATMEPAAERLRGPVSAEEAREAFGIASRRKAAAAAERARRLLLGTSLLDDLRRERALDMDEFARIRAPVSAVFGTASEMLPSAKRLQALVPGTQIHTIEGAGHLEVFGHTRELVRLIRQHLAARRLGREVV
jgi:pimeloyl-ACP methyl ester carboxylesterase